MQRYGRGWFGDKTAHSLAARGISSKRKYNAAKQIAEPIFYARKRESELPFSHIQEMVRSGKSFTDMKDMHPDADHEDLRKRAIKAIEMREMDGTLSTVDNSGVDKLVAKVKRNPRDRAKVENVLNDSQKGSFIASIKRDAILKQLG